MGITDPYADQTTLSDVMKESDPGKVTVLILLTDKTGRNFCVGARQCSTTEEDVTSGCRKAWEFLSQSTAVLE